MKPAADKALSARSRHASPRISQSLPPAGAAEEGGYLTLQERRLFFLSASFSAVLLDASQPSVVSLKMLPFQLEEKSPDEMRLLDATAGRPEALAAASE